MAITNFRQILTPFTISHEGCVAEATKGDLTLKNP
jgi:hypothetical protein